MEYPNTKEDQSEKRHIRRYLGSRSGIIPDIIVADYPFCALTAFRNKDKGLAAGDARLTFEPLGIAMREDTLLINWMRNFMTIIEGSGLLDDLRNHWFNEKVWVKELP